MTIASVARKLTSPQREILIEHAIGPVPIDLRVSHEGAIRRSTVNSLFTLNLIRKSGQSPRPTATVMTDLGREVCCFILGQYADALVRTGLLQEAMNITLRPAERWIPAPGKALTDA